MAEPLPVHRSREYETIFIVHPDTPAETMDHIAERITDVITRLNGKLLKAENWGKRRLAYHVKKQASGHYIYVRYLGYSDMVHEIERNLRMLEPVIKHISVKIEEDVNPESRQVAETDISFVPQVEEEPEAAVEEEESDDDEFKAASDEDDVDDDDVDESNDDTEDEDVDGTGDKNADE